MPEPTFRPLPAEESIILTPQQLQEFFQGAKSVSTEFEDWLDRLLNTPADKILKITHIQTNQSVLETPVMKVSFIVDKL